MNPINLFSNVPGNLFNVTGVDIFCDIIKIILNINVLVISVLASSHTPFIDHKGRIAWHGAM